MFAARARSSSISAKAASKDVPPIVGDPRGAAAGRDGVSPIRVRARVPSQIQIQICFGVGRVFITYFDCCIHDNPFGDSISLRAARGRSHGLVLAMTAAALEEFVEDLLERLSDIGISCDDVTCEDVLSKNVPARFVRVGAHLASDVAAVVATGTVPVDDKDGVASAVSAIYRSAANASTNPTAAAARVEQGLNRLAAALDKHGSAANTDVASTLNQLVTYVQVGTILERRKQAKGDASKPAAEVDAQNVGAMDAMDAANSAPSLDPKQQVRVSKQLWHLVNGARFDDGVAREISARTISHNETSASSAPDATNVLQASLTAVRRALNALPTDHLARAISVEGKNSLTSEENELLRQINAALKDEYATRKETVARRAWLTVQSFGQSARLKMKGDPSVLRTFSERAGFSDNGDAIGVDEKMIEGDKKVHDDDDDSYGHLPTHSSVSLDDVWDCRLADLARLTQRVNAEAGQQLDASVKRVRIGSVPDRGGRTDVSGDSKKNMPAFTERNPDAAKHSGGGGRGGGGRGRGGERGGGGGRGGGGRNGGKGKGGGRGGGPKG